MGLLPELDLHVEHTSTQFFVPLSDISIISIDNHYTMSGPKLPSCDFLGRSVAFRPGSCPYRQILVTNLTPII